MPVTDRATSAPNNAASALGHLESSLRAHGADSVKGVLAHGKDLVLSLIGIGDHAAEEGGGASRDVGDTMGDQSSRTRLGEGEGRFRA